jgi:hypothetical protein
MTHEEYIKRLNALRKEYADSIRQRAEQERDDFNLITHAETEALEYHAAVTNLIRLYQETRVDNPLFAS